MSAHFESTEVAALAQKRVGCEIKFGPAHSLIGACRLRSSDRYAGGQRQALETNRNGLHRAGFDIGVERNHAGGFFAAQRQPPALARGLRSQRHIVETLPEHHHLGGAHVDVDEVGTGALISEAAHGALTHRRGGAQHREGGIGIKFDHVAPQRIAARWQRRFLCAHIECGPHYGARAGRIGGATLKDRMQLARQIEINPVTTAIKLRACNGHLDGRCAVAWAGTHLKHCIQRPPRLHGGGADQQAAFGRARRVRCASRARPYGGCACRTARRVRCFKLPQCGATQLIEQWICITLAHALKLRRTAGLRFDTSICGGYRQLQRPAECLRCDISSTHIALAKSQPPVDIVERWDFSAKIDFVV